jgi:hypothetical protein
MPDDLLLEAALHTCGDPFCYRAEHRLPLEDVMTRWARCNFDGQPMSPGDAAIISRFADWLAMPPAERASAARNDPDWQEFLGITRESLLRAGPRPERVLRERRDDGYGPYWQEWYCEPPGPGQHYRVSSQEWGFVDREPVRRIYAIERITDAAEEDAAAAGPPGRPGGVRPGPGSPPAAAAPAAESRPGGDGGHP